MFFIIKLIFKKAIQKLKIIKFDIINVFLLNLKSKDG